MQYLGLFEAYIAQDEFFSGVYSINIESARRNVCRQVYIQVAEILYIFIGTEGGNAEARTVIGTRTDIGTVGQSDHESSIQSNKGKRQQQQQQQQQETPMTIAEVVEDEKEDTPKVKKSLTTEDSSVTSVKTSNKNDRHSTSSLSQQRTTEKVRKISDTLTAEKRGTVLVLPYTRPRFRANTLSRSAFFAVLSGKLETIPSEHALRSYRMFGIHSEESLPKDILNNI
ncbi:hypothetical protein RFI_10499, partial [Reticulomyxa filosa]